MAILPLTGDRGLAGAFNAQIVRRALQLEREVRAEGAEVRWVVVAYGRKPPELIERSSFVRSLRQVEERR